MRYRPMVFGCSRYTRSEASSFSFCRRGSFDPGPSARPCHVSLAPMLSVNFGTIHALVERKPSGSLGMHVAERPL